MSKLTSVKLKPFVLTLRFVRAQLNVDEASKFVSLKEIIISTHLSQQRIQEVITQNLPKFHHLFWVHNKYDFKSFLLTWPFIAQLGKYTHALDEGDIDAGHKASKNRKNPSWLAVFENSHSGYGVLHQISAHTYFKKRCRRK